MKKIYVIGAVMMFLLAMAGIAYDASTPYTVTLQWIVPSDTTFSIALCGAESSIDFDENLDAATDTEVQPDCQNATDSTPILVITNDGNQNLNFTNNLTTNKPTWAVLKVSNTSTYANALEFNTSAVRVGDDVVPAGTVDIYLWTDLTDALAGTTQRTYQIDVEQ